jgi:hypothetical protein
MRSLRRWLMCGGASGCRWGTGRSRRSDLPSHGIIRADNLVSSLAHSRASGVSSQTDKKTSETLSAYALARLRRGSGAGSGFPAFTALPTAISANINGPRSSTAAISISTASSHSALRALLSGATGCARQHREASRARGHQARRWAYGNGATRTRDH